MATTQEVDLLRRQLEELNARVEDIGQQSANAAMNAAVTGLTKAVRTMGQYDCGDIYPATQTAVRDIALRAHDAHTKEHGKL